MPLAPRSGSPAPGRGSCSRCRSARACLVVAHVRAATPARQSCWRSAGFSSHRPARNSMRWTSTGLAPITCSTSLTRPAIRLALWLRTLVLQGAELRRQVDDACLLRVQRLELLLAAAVELAALAFEKVDSRFTGAPVQQPTTSPSPTRRDARADVCRCAGKITVQQIDGLLATPGSAIDPHRPSLRSSRH